MQKQHQSSASFTQVPPLPIIVLSVVFLTIAVVLWAALLTYNSADPAWRHNAGNTVTNSLGTMGAWYSDLSFSLIGKLSYLIPFACFIFAVHLWREKNLDKELFSWRLFMLLTAILSGCVLWAKHDLHAINTVSQTGGGAVGAWLAIGLEKSIKSMSIIMAFSGAIFAVSMSLLLNFPWGKLADSIGVGIATLLSNIFSGLKKNKPHQQKNQQDQSALQDKIKHLNQTAEQRKNTEYNEETPADKPQFTIDRFQPEEFDPNSQSSYDNQKFIADAGMGTIVDKTPDLAFQTHKETISNSTEIPLNINMKEAVDDAIQTPADSNTKSEPNFFDFSDINTTESPKSELRNKTADDSSVDFFTNNTVSKNSGSESLSYSTNKHDINNREAKFEIPVTPELSIPVKETSSSTATPYDMPIPEAKPQRTRTQEQSFEPEHEQPKVVTEPEYGIVDETVIAPVNAVEERTMEESKPTISPPVKASTATIASNYDKHSAFVDNQQIENDRTYELPSIDLLDVPPAEENAYTEDALADMASVLEQTLNQFNIKATVMHVSPGPVITRFELELAPGIQAKKITGLSQDLARALAVSRVRVEEVIPGSSYVGLEVPNKQRQTVYFHDIIKSKVFQESTSPLTISLGSDTSGKPQVADLMKMPHALVAGTTGSGKSVCINVMLLSMLYKTSPKDLRLILVDPKMLEMSMYEDIPHLLTPVITDMTEAENALTWAVGEMERRYQLMSALKVRKIDAFNEHIEQAIADDEPIKDPLWQPDESVGYTHHPTLERLPFIVIVIDELADMMMVVGKQVEQLIARLTQKARAAGIHVVLATQRPSTDVLTGLIKANVPTRIAFQVSSGTDSRVIIDGVGAEKLLGHGDMLYVPPGASHPQRFHGAFVGDAETDRITNYLRSTAEPQYIDGITGKQSPESLGAFGAADAASTKEDADPLYEEAVEFVIQSNKASISSVQRQLRIGYNRAARMIEDMQEQGIVSAPNNGVRKVLGR